MNIELSVAVAAHHTRQTQAMRLASDLWKESGKDIRLVWDEHNNEWDTHSRAWAACLRQSGATHGLVLEDDAVPAPDLLNGAVRATSRFPESAISLYFGTHENPSLRTSRARITREAAARAEQDPEVSWITTRHLLWGVGVILPVQWIEPMLDYWSRRKTGLYDERINKWLLAHGHGGVLNTWPSLVDHADGASLLHPGRKPGRRAFRVADTALNWDPSGRVILA